MSSRTFLLCLSDSTLDVARAEISLILSDDSVGEN